jgi:hypothetical protein
LIVQFLKHSFNGGVAFGLGQDPDLVQRRQRKIEERRRKRRKNSSALRRRFSIPNVRQQYRIFSKLIRIQDPLGCMIGSRVQSRLVDKAGTTFLGLVKLALMW